MKNGFESKETNFGQIFIYNFINKSSIFINKMPVYHKNDGSKADLASVTI
jgi:hypothetical protein